MRKHGLYCGAYLSPVALFGITYGLISIALFKNTTFFSKYMANYNIAKKNAQSHSKWRL